MTVTIAPSEPTLDEIEEKATTLFHVQRVNFEAADEVQVRAKPLWKRLATLTGNTSYRLRDVAYPHPDKNGGIFTRQWSGAYTSGTAFTRTAALAPLLEEGCWPDFHYADEEKHELITVWTELIGLAEEAGDISTAIGRTGAELSSLLMWAERGREAQELRGWYVSARTSRRVTTGWVVGGRGNTLHILADPSPHLIRIDQVTTHHKDPITDKKAAESFAIRALSPSDSTPEKYSLKTATITMIFPPDMARERRVWVNEHINRAATFKDEATKIWEKYVEWRREADPLIAKDKKFKEWEKQIAKDFYTEWTGRGGQLRWAHGATEAFNALLRLTGITEEALREEMTKEYFAVRPENVLTETERAFILAPPMGEGTLAGSLAQVYLSKHTGLAPVF